MSEDAADNRKDEGGPILDDGQDRKLKSSAVKTVVKVVAALVVAALLISIPTMFSKEARVKRSFNKAVKAFEKKDLEKALDFISEKYNDNWSNTKATFTATLPMIFDAFKGINVQIKELEIEFEGADTAKLTVDARVIITQKDDTKGLLPLQDPITLILKKEGRKWRLHSAKGLNMSIDRAFEEIF